MKKYLVLLFVCISCLVSAEEIKLDYQEDNAAYWYLKSYEAIPEFPENQGKALSNIKTLEDAKKVCDEEDFDLMHLVSGKYIDYLKKAKEIEKCVFFEKYLCRESKFYYPSGLWFLSNSHKMEAIAWILYCNNNKRKAAYIVLNNLEMIRKITKDENYDAVCAALSMEKAFLKQLKAFCDDSQNSRDEIFKNMLMEAVQKQISKPICSFNDILRYNYEYALNAFSNYEKDYNNIAPLFVSLAQQVKDKEYDTGTDSIDEIAATLAKTFMTKNFPKEKQELIDYYNKIINYDYSKPLTHEEANKELDFYNLGYSEKNALFIKFGMDVWFLYDRIYTPYIEAYNSLFKQ